MSREATKLRSFRSNSQEQTQDGSAWAQARFPIPCLDTTHADYFRGPVPVTDVMTGSEIVDDYEKNAGDVIVKALHGSDYKLALRF
jgi:L-ribulose-5-phosphate 4-epimerase